MSCCPPGSLGPPPLNSIALKGSTRALTPKEGSTRSELNCYQVGPIRPKSVILVYPDVYGFEAGNHRAFCDVLQQKLGDDTAVWMPDLFRGNPIMTPSWAWALKTKIVWELLTRFTAKNVMGDLNEVILHNLSDCETVGVVGFCYGAWNAARTIGIKEATSVKACVGIHPSWQIELVMGGTEGQLAANCGTTPVLLCVAGNDKLKLGTEIVQQLAQQRGVEEDEVVVEFNDMVHGWVPRGDSNDPKVKKCQDKAVELTVDFLKKHLNL